MLIADALVKSMANINGKWCVARPMPAPFAVRLIDAWLVLIGKADAVKFYKQ